MWSPLPLHIFVLYLCRYKRLYMQIQLEHREDQEYAAAWEVDVDQTVTRQRDGTESVLIVATITSTSLLGLASVLERAHVNCVGELRLYMNA